LRPANEEASDVDGGAETPGWTPIVPSTKRQGPTVAYIVGGVVLVLVLLGGAIAYVVSRHPVTTTVMLSATDPTGRPLTNEALERARAIVDERLAAMGMDDPDVAVSDGNLVVTVGGPHEADDFAAAVAPGDLRFRKVLDIVAEDSGESAVRQAANEPAGAGVEEQRRAVLAKLGSAATIAQAITSPIDVAADPDLMRALEPFHELSPSQVAVLTPTMQFNVPQITCAMLKARPTGSITDAASVVAACDESGTWKYLLDVAKVVGTDVKTAAAQNDVRYGWQVNVFFTASGQKAWTNLTKEAYHNTGNQCGRHTLDGDGRCAVAIVLDNTVISAPAILAVITGDTSISGGTIDEAGAKKLAVLIKTGSLPVRLHLVKLTTT
jgi:preprotein translocase subunit SecD